MNLEVYDGATSVSVDVFIGDSTVTTGAGLTGLAFNTAGLTAYYYQPGHTAATAITLATLASATAAFSSGGFKEIDATNMPGHYRLDIPNAAISTSNSSPECIIVLRGATNMRVTTIEIGILQGHKLLSTGLDNVSITAATGVAANFREMLIDVWRLGFKKSLQTTTTRTTYRDDGTTVKTTQTVSDSGGIQTLGAAT